jgi:hypothetical protein
MPLPFTNMKGNWIKFIYEQDIYVVDLDCICTFVCAENGRLIFWLPDGKVQIIIHPKSNSQVYQQILDYLENLAEQLPLPVSRARLDRVSPDKLTNSEISQQGGSDERIVPEPELDVHAK